MNRPITSVAIVGLFSIGLLVTLSARAEVTVTGNVEPGDPSTCTESSFLYIGKSADGTMRVDGGTTIYSYFSAVGRYDGAHGEVTLDGEGTQWINHDEFYVGRGAGSSGEVNIINGARLWTYEAYISDEPGTEGVVNIMGPGSRWENRYWICVGGNAKKGILNITRGGYAVSDSCGVYRDGTVTIDGPESRFLNDWLSVYAIDGTAIVNVTGGAQVDSENCTLGKCAWETPAMGRAVATISGAGSVLRNQEYLVVGAKGVGQLTIADGGMVTVGTTLTIDQAGDGSCISMASGGMLALHGEAHESLADFYNLIEGTDAIRWWDQSLDAWAPLTTAVVNRDYHLDYLSEGNLAGYTVLTVTAIPEPAAFSLLLIALLAVGIARTRRQL